MRAFSSTNSTVLLLRGGNRAELRARVEDLAQDTGSGTPATLPELARAASAAAPGGSHAIAIVADTVADLAAKLKRSSAQLADGRRVRIHDRHGVYFNEEPLGREGKLAILFPGEGSQYPNALTDLAIEFPEVAALIASRDVAKEAMWEMIPAISLALTGDMALFRILESLGVRPDVVVGHSTGEIAALMASGMIRRSEASDLGLLLDDLATFANPEALKDMPRTMLLAAGADAPLIESLISGIQPRLRVAMHNCPHQTVIVGDGAAAAVAIDRMRDQGILYEVLPFDRPYHTDLCAPLAAAVMGSYRKWIDSPPRTQIYSCTTARPFPDELDEARTIASGQWTSRIEFPKTIEAMYADGVRVFVESGPRGNLSAFVGDILRGRPHAAIPANIAQRSGPDQLLHMLAQLASHGIAVEIPGLDQPENPPPRRIAEAKPALKLNGRWPNQDASRPPTASGETPRASQILSAHNEFMTHFYSAQESVMLAYLAKLNASSGSNLPAGPAASPADAVPLADIAAASHILPLIGTILSYNPGKDLVALRDFNVDEDLFLRHHSFSRDVSVDDPSLTGLPIMPLTMSIEMMLEAGSLLYPGMVQTTISDIQALRWVTTDTGRFTLRVEARSSTATPNAVDVAIHQHDSAPVESGSSSSLRVQATVRFAPRATAPPPPKEFAGVPSRMNADRDVIYQTMMWHGKSFQGIARLDAIADDGAEALFEVLPRDSLFLSNPEPRFLTDPVLLDQVGQLLGVWMNHHGGAFPMAFPRQISSIEFFSPPLEVGAGCRCVLSDAFLTNSEVGGSADVVTRDGQVWARISGWESRCFDVPGFYTMQWYAPRDYLLCSRWPEAEALCAGVGEVSAFHVSVNAFPEGFFEAFGGIWLRSLAHTILSRRERESWRALRTPANRRLEWLLGRSAAKDAIRFLLKSRFGLTVPPADIEIEAEASGRPRAGGAWTSRVPWVPSLSLSHSSGTAVAIVTGDACDGIGIDLEHLSALNDDLVAGGFTSDELRLIDSTRIDRGEEWLLRAWCAKEAAAKALGEGFRNGPRRFRVTGLSPDGSVEITAASESSGDLTSASNNKLQTATGYDGEFAVAVCLVTNSATKGVHERNEQFA